MRRTCALGWLTLAPVALAACADGTASLAPAPTAPSYSAGSHGHGDFHRYVAIGTSISMGVQSDGVTDSTQRTSWPAQLAELAGRSLPQPLIEEPGCQSPLVAPIAANR